MNLYLVRSIPDVTVTLLSRNADKWAAQNSFAAD